MQISLLRSRISNNISKFISNNVYKDPYISERARNEKHHVQLTHNVTYKHA